MQLRAAMINSGDAMGVKKNPRDKQRGNPESINHDDDTKSLSQKVKLTSRMWKFNPKETVTAPHTEE